jgi:hypothetical protein
MDWKHPSLSFEKFLSCLAKVVLTASPAANYSEHTSIQMGAIMGENPLHCAEVHGSIASTHCAGCSPWKSIPLDTTSV